jgi:hypothetical protein
MNTDELTIWLIRSGMIIASIIVVIVFIDTLLPRNVFKSFGIPKFLGSSGKKN